MDLTVTGPDLHSVGTKPMSKVHGFILSVAFPAATSHAGRTFALKVTNLKTGATVEFTGPGTGFTVANETISMVFGPTSEAGGVTVASLMSGDCAFGFDVYATTLYTSALIAGVRGNVKWVDSTGAFTDFVN